MSSNIHGFDHSNSGRVGIQSSTSMSNNDDRIFIPSIYKLRTVTCFLLILNISIYLFQVIAFYMFYAKKGNTWSCLLIRFGAFQGGKIRNHYEFHRFISATFLHNSIAHMGSNCLSLFFLGYQVEHEINNKLYYALLYFISGLAGGFVSLAFNQNNISVGASGAIIGLCGNFVIYFLLNYKNMSERKRYSYGTMFLFLFINLFSGLAEGNENINMAAHIGGFLGGFAFSIILAYKKNVRLQFNSSFTKKLYIASVAFLILLPIGTILIVSFKKISNSTDYICRK
jgi:rhomboid protease GluP